MVLKANQFMTLMFQLIIFDNHEYRAKEFTRIALYK